MKRLLTLIIVSFLIPQLVYADRTTRERAMRVIKQRMKYNSGASDRLKQKEGKVSKAKNLDQEAEIKKDVSLNKEKAYKWTPEEKYRVYLDSIKTARLEEDGAKKKEYQHRVYGTLKSIVLKNDRKGEELLSSYYANGALKTKTNIYDKKVDYRKSGLQKGSEYVKPFLESEDRLENFILGIQESANPRIYPVDENETPFGADNSLTGKFFIYDENTVPAQKVTFKDGIIDGPFVGYYPAGYYKFEGSYNQGVLDGPYKRYGDPRVAGGEIVQGRIVEEGSYKNGALDGKIVRYSPTGDKIYEFPIDQGVLDGEVLSYYSNGKVKERCSFEKNRRSGLCSITNPNNVIVREQSFENGIPAGKYVERYDDGTVSKVAFYKNGLLNGDYKEFHKYGGLVKLVSYKNGKAEGPVSHYYKDGTIKAELVLLNGKKNGLSTLYYPDGKVKAEIEYKDGLRNGKQVLYYNTGQVYEVSNFWLGEKKGVSTTYSKTGVPIGGTATERATDNYKPKTEVTDEGYFSY